MKHAFLIMAHDQLEMLKNTMEALDHEDNALFVHVDLKCSAFDEADFESICHLSSVTFIERRSLSWGGYSLVECELHLLDIAQRSGPFGYYHLISGVDYPLKSNEYIHSFFAQNIGKEFIHVDVGWTNQSEIRRRYMYYHPLQEYWGRCNTLVKKALRRVTNMIMIGFQKFVLRVDRRRQNKNTLFHGGMQWFSISNDFCSYVLSKKDWIFRTFRMGLCVDEIFLQTVVMNSPFSESVFTPNCADKCVSSMRLIDWGRGKPYTWKLADFPELVGSSCLFARKFSCRTEDEKELIKSLKAHSASKHKVNDQAIAPMNT
ncbi:MAG: beta-1,6-N-acetylglucosaminyltransferase [Christensenellales bacterium]|jgi:hypothetical protein